ncbi:MAG: hypothetical protein OHK0022_26840 [Roseiflexaceae bacterium]
MDKQPFLFQIDLDALVEVHGDPGGHYRHHTIIVGSLLEGTLRVGDLVLLPDREGAPLVAVVGGFDAFYHALGPTVSAADAPPVFAVMLRRPAPPKARLTAGLARPYPQEDRPAALLELLRHDPAIFFHYQGRDPAPLGLRCGQCLAALRGLPGVRPLLEQLRNHPDPAVARSVEVELNGEVNK